MCRARQDIALKISTNPAGLTKGALGMAHPLAASGLNARVFDDRIRAAAARWNRPYTLVLAHAIAHEIGHVLLRSDSHAARGLMGPVWSAYEYGWMDHGLMFFTEEQSRTMRATLRKNLLHSGHRVERHDVIGAVAQAVVAQSERSTRAGAL